MWLTVLAIVALVALVGVSVAIMVHLVVGGVNGRVAAYSVPTPREALAEIVVALGLEPGKALYELGCGDGRVLAAALRREPRIRAVGVDNDPVWLGVAWWRTRGRARLYLGDMMKLSYGEADRVFVYLGPKLMAALEGRFEQELPKGARVVSLQFALPNRKPDRVIELKRARAHAQRLYIYEY